MGEDGRGVVGYSRASIMSGCELLNMGAGMCGFFFFSFVFRLIIRFENKMRYLRKL